MCKLFSGRDSQKTNQNAGIVKKQSLDIEKNYHEMTVKISDNNAKNINERNMTSTQQGDCCDAHGGTSGYRRQWNVATCKSNCNTGIGFRCGGSMYRVCADGFYCDPRPFSPSCPPVDTTPTPPASASILKMKNFESKIPQNNRSMDANCIFYSNNTIKFLFQNSLPKAENSNNIMEVEDEILDEFPAKTLLDGKPYRGYIPTKGNYAINRNEGKFGSVTIKVKFIQ